MPAKKSVKKYNTGGPTGTGKTRTVTKSPDGNYRTVTKSKSGPSGFSNSTNTRRTIKGVISGAPKAVISSAPKPGQEPLDTINSSNLKNVAGRDNQKSNITNRAAARDRRKEVATKMENKGMVTIDNVIQPGYGINPYKPNMPKQKKGGSVKRKTK